MPKPKEQMHQARITSTVSFTKGVDHCSKRLDKNRQQPAALAAAVHGTG
jgi:hypothetical protein